MCKCGVVAKVDLRSQSPRMQSVFKRCISGIKDMKHVSYCLISNCCSSLILNDTELDQQK